MLLVGNYNHTFCQKFQNGYWLPEKYIQIIKETKDKKVADSSIKWIYSLRIFNDSIYVQCLHKDMYDVEMTEIDSTTTEIRGIGCAGNPNQFNELKSTRFFISPYYDKILLKQIYNDSIVDSIIFTDKIDDKFIIEYPDNSIDEIICTGSYKLMLPSLEVIDPKIILTLGGEISGSTFLETYKITNNCLTYEDSLGKLSCCDIFKFTYKNGKSKKFAQKKKGNLMYFYEYYLGKNVYMLGNLVYILEKIK
jgi:hypothetical protein